MDTKYCKMCDKPIPKVSPSGKKRSLSVYKKMQYCGKKCSVKNAKNSKDLTFGKGGFSKKNSHERRMSRDLVTRFAAIDDKLEREWND